MSIGQRIKSRREELGMTQPQLAAELTEITKRKWAQSTVSAWEQPEGSKNHRRFLAEFTEPVAKALGVSLVWLLTGKDEQPTTASYDELYLSRKILQLPPKKRYGLSLILDIDLTLRGAPPVIHQTKLDDLTGDEHAGRKTR